MWEERSPRRQAMIGKELVCYREFRCWCSATTLYWYTTPCQPLTARTDDLYPFVYYLNFWTPSATYLPRVKNNNNNNMLDSLDYHHRVNASPLWSSPSLTQSTAMLFSSWASRAVGDWWRRPGMFEHLRFYSNGFLLLWCNDLILLCYTMVSLMTTGQSRCTTKQFVGYFFCAFWAI